MSPRLLRLLKVGSVVLGLSPLLLYVIPQTRWLPRVQADAAWSQWSSRGVFSFCGTCAAYDAMPAVVWPEVYDPYLEIVQADGSRSDLFTRACAVSDRYPVNEILSEAAIRIGVMALRRPYEDRDAKRRLRHDSEGAKIAKSLLVRCRDARSRWGENGIYWLGSAIAHDVLGDIPARNDALRRAVRAPRFQTTAPEYAQAVQRVFRSCNPYAGIEYDENLKFAPAASALGWGAEWLMLDIAKFEPDAYDVRRMGAFLALRFASHPSWEQGFAAGQRLFIAATYPRKEGRVFDSREEELVHHAEELSAAMKSAGLDSESGGLREAAQVLGAANDDYNRGIERFGLGWMEIYFSASTIAGFVFVAQLLLGLGILYVILRWSWAPELNPALAGAIFSTVIFFVEERTWMPGFVILMFGFLSSAILACSASFRRLSAAAVAVSAVGALAITEIEDFQIVMMPVVVYAAGLMILAWKRRRGGEPKLLWVPGLILMMAAVEAVGETNSSWGSEFLFWTVLPVVFVAVLQCVSVRIAALRLLRCWPVAVALYGGWYLGEAWTSYRTDASAAETLRRNESLRREIALRVAGQTVAFREAIAVTGDD
ncbi:MAG: hypothetical protein AKCLJLPJ_00041 [Fimbriimonadales bacterium]|nr:hypothetical protein [Fimbriimonadales bacterium]